MRLASIIALLFLASLWHPAARAQQPADEAAIRAVLAREVDGWIKFDPSQLLSVYTDDATWQNPFGVRLHGKAAMQKFFVDLMARPGFRAGKDTSATKVLDLRFTSPTTAAVWSDERIVGLVNDLSGKPMDPRHSFYLEVLVKKDGLWKITDELVMDIVHPK